MPRPKTTSDRDVVRATAKVLLREGPVRLTLAYVAREAGLSPAALLQRFGSKRGLMLAFAQTAAAEAATPFQRARSAIPSPLEALRTALVGASSDTCCRQEIAHSLAVLLDDIPDDEMRAAAALHARATERAIRALLDEAVSAGELGATDTGQLAISLQAAWNGAVIQWALRGSGTTLERFLDRVLAPLLHRSAPTRRMRSRSHSPKADR